MDDPGISWPFWKFGLKRDDLYTTLHDQYNTFPSSIQDREAFHHDVFELSTEASSADEFHRLMASRKEQRLRELNESMESAAIEIIANPLLIGTEQWQHAIQLFRSRSLDSIVRYFASYLPEDHPWHRSDSSSYFSSASSFVDSESVDADSLTDSDHHSYYTEEQPIISQEPLLDASATHPPKTTHHEHLPPSPESMMCSDASSVSSDDNDHFVLTPARTLSFSESEPDHIPSKDAIPILQHHRLPHHHNHDDGASSTDSHSISSVSDISETQHQKDFLAEPLVLDDHEISIVDDDGHIYPGTQLPEDDDDASLFESETPTPKPRSDAPTPTSTTGATTSAPSGGAPSFFFEAKPSPLSSSTSYSCYHHLRTRSASPTRTHLSSHIAAAKSSPLSHAAATTVLAVASSDCRKLLQPSTMVMSSLSPSARSARRRDLSPSGKARRNGSGHGNNGCCSSIGSVSGTGSGSGISSGRIQKPASEPLRSRPRARRREESS